MMSGNGSAENEGHPADTTPTGTGVGRALGRNPLANARIPQLTQGLGLGIVLLALCVVAAFATPVFPTTGNAVNIARAVALIGIVSIGQTFVLITGNIDLAVGATAAMAGVVLAETQGLGLVVSILLALLSGAIIGVLHGIIVTRTGMSSLIVTLATMTALRGGVYIATNGFPLPIHSKWFSTEVWHNFVGIPIPAIVFIVLLVIAYVTLSWTRTGWWLYAIGGNAKASEEAGLAVRRLTIVPFIVSGVTAAIAGILLSARFASAAADAGMGWELISIAAVVIGGTSLMGGRGDIVGTLLGVLLLGVIANAMDLRGINSFYQQIVQGLLILVAVGASTYRLRAERRVSSG
jgi:ribose transport system permease protein